MIVDSDEKLELAIEFIRNNEVIAYDTETTGLNVRLDTVVGFGISNATTGFYFPLHFWNGNVLVPYDNQRANKILTLLYGKKLLCFNASFDMRITKNNLGQDLLNSLHCDVLLLKHTCDEEFPFGLKEIAAKIWGHDVKKEKEEMQASIKANGGTPKQYYKASTDTLAKYCIADCLLTYRLYNHYSDDLTRQGLHDFFYEDEVLPLYKHVTIPMENRGVKVDVEKMKAVLAEINVDIKKLEDRIQQAVAANLGIFKAWFLNKEYPLRSVGGRESAWTKKHATQAEAWAADNPGVYMFNIQSKVHLKRLFFDALGCTPRSTTPTGLPQIDEEFLYTIVEQYPWVSDIIEYNKLNKIKSTYIERFLDEQEDGVFYPSWMQHRTVSGRYGGDLQQLPRTIEQGQASELIVKYTNVIREFIIPREGCKLVSADYEQLEPTVFSHTSGDSALQDIFRQGADFYSTVAIRTEHIRGASPVKGLPNYLGLIAKNTRQRAKTYALGIAYGMSGYKLKFEIGVDADVAEDLVRRYLAAFPKLKEWIDKTHLGVIEHGKVQTLTGRVRHLPEIQRLHKFYGPAIRDDLLLWKRYHKSTTLYTEAKAARKVAKNQLNNAVNFQVQGLAASIVNRAAIQLSKYRIIGQIHDELLFEVPISELENTCNDIKQVMENVMPLSVPLRTVPQAGVTYRDCK